MEAVNYEGWRVTVDQGDGRRGWLLLRQSLHDPLLVLNVESDQEGGKHCAAAALPVRCPGKCSFGKHRLQHGDICGVSQLSRTEKRQATALVQV
jgi:hypothetical protein